MRREGIRQRGRPRIDTIIPPSLAGQWMEDTGSSPGWGSQWDHAFRNSSVAYVAHSPLQWRDRAGFAPASLFSSGTLHLCHVFMAGSKGRQNCVWTYFLHNERYHFSTEMTRWQGQKTTKFASGARKIECLGRKRAWKWKKLPFAAAKGSTDGVAADEGGGCAGGNGQ